MDEETENMVVKGPAEPEESGTAGEDELTADFKNTLDISQGLESPEPASSEKTQSWKKPEHRDAEGEEGEGQQEGQKDGEREGEGDGQIARQQDGQKDGERDGQTVHPCAAEPGTESKWAVGAQCRAVWSEDGQLYPATVLCLDGERCRVRFNGYGNQQDMELSALKSPDAAPQTQRQNSQDWKPGARCRAVYAEDGLVYPAVVLWVKGQRCCVRFDDYNNEEEVDADSLLNPDELHGPSRATAAKGSNWQVIVTNGKVDWKMRKKEESHGERGGEGRREESQGEIRREESQGERGGEGRREESQGERRREESQGERGDERRREESQGERGDERRREESQGERGGERRREESQGERGGERRREESQGERGGERRRENQGERGGEKRREENTSQRKVEKEEEKKKRRNQPRDEAEKPTNHSFSFFPPFPPPPSPRSASGDAVSFISPPPPPPLWAFGGKESSSAAVDASSSMLMLWYMCGFHTGSYMAQQGFQSSSKD